MKTNIAESLTVFVIAMCSIVFFIEHSGSMTQLYYYRQTDLQEDYFYGGLSILKMGGIYQPSHPGTPVYYLVSLIMSFFDSPIMSAQSVFHILYIAAGITLALSMSFFISAPSDISLGLRLLPMSALFLWPPTLTYIVTFGADSFTLAAGLMVAAFIWRMTHKSDEWATLSLLLTGTIGGILISVKLSLIIVVVGAIISLLLHEILRINALPRKWLFFMGTGLLVGLLIGFWPIAWNVHNSILFLISSQGHTSSIAGLTDVLLSFIHPIRNFSTFSLYALFGLLVTTVASFFIGVALCYRKPDLRINILPRLVFIFIIMAGLLRSVFVQYSEYNPNLGVSLRNSLPFISALPFGFLLFCSLLKNHAGERASTIIRQSSSFPAMATAFLLISISLWTHADKWSQLFRGKTNEYQAAMSLVSPLPTNLESVAILEIPSEANFHYSGNQKYAGNQFDHLVILAFPQWSYLRDHVLGGHQRTPKPELPDDLSLGQILLHWWRYLPGPPTAYKERVLTPTIEGRTLGAILVPIPALLNTGCDLDCLSEKLPLQGYKILDVKRHSISARDYYVIRLTP